MNHLPELIEERHCARVPFQDRAHAEEADCGEAVKNLVAATGHMKAAFAVRLGHRFAAAPDPRVRREVAEFAQRNFSATN